jgi:poly(A) polymerase
VTLGPARLAAPWLAAPECRRVVAALTRGGRPVRFVGGAVRDSLRDPGFDPQDLDLATPEPPERVVRLLGEAGLEPIPTGLAHGTVTCVLGARRFEITTLRCDLRTDGRRAEVAWTEDFLADAARRDFTINALSLDPDGTLHDPFGGRADLAQGRIRFVGDPATRIAEDYLRILRFFRFLASHGRPPVDAPALAACAAGQAGLDRLSGERVRAELMKLLAASRAGWALALMAETGILARLLGPAADPARVERLIAAFPESDAGLRLAALVHGGDPGALATRLRLSRAEARRLATLAPLPPPDPAALRRLARLDPDQPQADRIRLDAALHGATPAHRAAVALAERFTPEPFPLTGDDLHRAGLAPGRAFGRLLAELRGWWAAQDPPPDRAACLAELARRLRPA